jgi:hypothetical protein
MVEFVMEHEYVTRLKRFEAGGERHRIPEFHAGYIDYSDCDDGVHFSPAPAH